MLLLLIGSNFSVFRFFSVFRVLILVDLANSLPQYISKDVQVRWNGKFGVSRYR